MRLVTWNVAGRVTRQPEQAQAVAAATADVVALQEVTARTLPLWRTALADAGFTACEATLDTTPATPGRRLLGVLVAAREPLARLAPPPDVPWPERVLCCALGDLEIVNLHSPIAPAPELAKVRTHEAMAAYLGGRPRGPRILCGDLNTPRRELPDGDVLTFAHDSAGRLRPERGERWDRAERALVYGLRERGWVDAFRTLHGYEGRMRAGRSPTTAAAGGSTTCSWTECTRSPRAYAHEWRRAGLSDHSALIVDLELP